MLEKLEDMTSVTPDQWGIVLDPSDLCKRTVVETEHLHRYNRLRHRLRKRLRQLRLTQLTNQVTV